MKVSELRNLLERASNPRNEAALSGRVASLFLYEGLPLASTKETLAQAREDRWLLTSTWRVAPERTAYKLANLTLTRSVRIEKWQLLEQDAEGESKGDSSPLVLKPARHLVVFDSAALFSLQGLAEKKPKPTKKIAVPREDEKWAESSEPQDSAPAILGLEPAAQGEKSPSGPAPGKDGARERQRETLPDRNSGDRGSKEPADGPVPRREGSFAFGGRKSSEIGIGVAVELRRAEPGVKIEKKFKN